MKYEVTPEEVKLFNDISTHGAGLWEKCVGVEGLSTDPKMFSIMLFKRLWSHHRGYALLWRNDFQLECDIILRSGLEAAICIAANNALREKFVDLLHGDAISTLKGQIKVHRDEGSIDLVRESEAVLRHLDAHLPIDIKPDRLNWRSLAEEGGVQGLYGWYRQLSGLSSHVTGASILAAIVPIDDPHIQDELKPLQRKMHLMMMAGATLEGARRHTETLEDNEGSEETVTLLTRLAELSWAWPGAKERPA